MEQHIAVDLIRKGVHATERQQWADLGCGDGTFTRALGSLLQEGSVIHAIDTNKRTLNALLPIPGIQVKKIAGDFSDEDIIPTALDGMVLANSIHYVADQKRLLGMLLNKLNRTGRLIIVEYDMDRSNPWVPYPLSFITLNKMITVLGLQAAEKIGQVPSQLNASDIYSALILK